MNASGEHRTHCCDSSGDGGLESDAEREDILWNNAQRILQL